MRPLIVLLVFTAAGAARAAYSAEPSPPAAQGEARDLASGPAPSVARPSVSIEKRLRALTEGVSTVEIEIR
jgi:hypothetical protein